MNFVSSVFRAWGLIGDTLQKSNRRLVFEERGKPLGAEPARTNKLNPHVTPCLGIETGATCSILHIELTLRKYDYKITVFATLEHRVSD